MRRKALLVAASGPFTGPWVTLEEGDWLLELPSFEGVQFQIHGRTEIESIEDTVFNITGPCRIRLLLPEEATDIFAHITQVSIS